ncbi:4Fe-4S dicluster domain-containing protein [Desulfobacula phenolica]|uniref:4Fe-4S dicluster domain-containing protein n=1 Tax=Desulfobacula phenolica TaxID=90732 RepID=A0A1H2DMY1_9BACT|nr:4Fe-4S dicluster domain-containing protein [Desulfobacula phenolica]SDT84262.1 4Fe-4S dicluster domain-containing protein [Desulfobacula phenolica]
MFLALYTSCVIICIGLLICLILFQIIKKTPQVILCTECRQCMAVCPLLSRGCNPMEIMLGAKINMLDKTMKNGGYLCVNCKKCRQACPRGLAPFEEAQMWKLRSSWYKQSIKGKKIKAA